MDCWTPRVDSGASTRQAMSIDGQASAFRGVARHVACALAVAHDPELSGHFCSKRSSASVQVAPAQQRPCPGPPRCRLAPCPADAAGRRPLCGALHERRPVLAQGPHRPRHRRLARHRPHDRRRLSAQGARVYISSRKAAACERPRRSSRHGRCISLPADVSRSRARRRWSRPTRRTSTLDILVNNAGAAWGAPFDEFPEKGWDKVVDLNLKTPFFLTQALIGRCAAAGADATRQGHQHRLDRRHLGQPAGDLFVRGEQGRTDPADPPHGAAPDRDNIVVSAIAPGAFASEMNRVARDHAEAVKAHPGGPHRRRRGHGRRGDLPRVARRRLRGGLDAHGRRRRDPRALKLRAQSSSAYGRIIDIRSIMNYDWGHRPRVSGRDPSRMSALPNPDLRRRRSRFAPRGPGALRTFWRLAEAWKLRRRADHAARRRPDHAVPVEAGQGRTARSARAGAAVVPVRHLRRAADPVAGAGRADEWVRRPKARRCSAAARRSTACWAARSPTCTSCASTSTRSAAERLEPPRSR